MSAPPDPPPNRTRSALGLVVRLAVSIGLLVWLLRLPETRQALAEVTSATTAAVVLAAALWYAGCQVLNAYKWDLILRGMGYRVPLRTLVRAFFIGQFANRFLPTGIGGDVARVVAVAQAGLPSSVGLLSAFLGRLTGLMAMLLLGLIGALAARGGTAGLAESILIGLATLSGAAVAACVIGAWVELRWHVSARLPERLGRPLRRLAEALGALRRAPVTLAWVMVVSLVFQLMMVGINALLGGPAGLELSVDNWFWYNAGVTVGSMVPTFGGLGARELVAGKLLAPLGMHHAGVVCSCLWQAAVILASLPGAVLWRSAARPPAAEPSP